MIGRFLTPKVEEQAEPRGFDDFDLRLGDLMRGERATLGKSLLDVQRELKIKAAYIAAIENADPTAFETQGFVAGYVRSYARYLGMDPEWAYAKFCKEGNFQVAHGMSAAASGQRAPQPRTPSEGMARDPFANPNTPFAPRGQGMFASIEPGALGSVAVLLALIAGLGYGGWSILREIQKVQFAPVDQAPGVVAEIDGIDPEGPKQVDERAGARLAEAPSAEALDRLYRPQALDVPVLVARDGPISALDPRHRGRNDAAETGAAQVATAAEPVVKNTDEAVAQALGMALPGQDQVAQVAQPEAPAAPGQTPAPQVLAAAPADVVMFAVRPSWVRVQSADGTVLFEKILDAGEKYVIPKMEEPARLRAGNAGSVYFAVNGKTYGPAGKGPSVVKNVALSSGALTGKYAVADLGADRDLADFVNVAQNSYTQAPQGQDPLE